MAALFKQSHIFAVLNSNLVKSNTSFLASSSKLLAKNEYLIKTNERYCSNESKHSGSSVPKDIWKLGRLNHIAIAVPNLDESVKFYRDVLRATVSAPQALPMHGVTTVFVELDNTKLELLHPLGDNSPIQKFLQKNKAGGLHHVCLEVDDIEVAVASVKAAGVRCLSPATKIGAHNKPVMFLHPADCNGVLLELEQA